MLLLEETQESINETVTEPQDRIRHLSDIQNELKHDWSSRVNSSQPLQRFQIHHQNLAHFDLTQGKKNTTFTLLSVHFWDGKNVTLNSCSLQWARISGLYVSQKTLFLNS